MREKDQLRQDPHKETLLLLPFLERLPFVRLKAVQIIIRLNPFELNHTHLTAET